MRHEMYKYTLEGLFRDYTFPNSAALLKRIGRS
jgi:hypothetical protein